MDAVVAFLCGEEARRHKYWLPTACRAYIECSNANVHDFISILEGFQDVADIIGIAAYKENLKLPKQEIMAALAAVALAQIIIDHRFTIRNKTVYHTMKYCHGCYLLFTGQGGQNLMQHEDGCFTPLSPVLHTTSPSPSCSPQDCRGCEDFKLGFGGENQTSHTCIR